MVMQIKLLVCVCVCLTKLELKGYVSIHSEKENDRKLTLKPTASCMKSSVHVRDLFNKEFCLVFDSFLKYELN